MRGRARQCSARTARFECFGSAKPQPDPPQHRVAQGATLRHQTDASASASASVAGLTSYQSRRRLRRRTACGRHGRAILGRNEGEVTQISN